MSAQNLKWFRFSQNSSGGSFVEDENVCEEVFIEAENAEAAIAKAETFCDNSDSCECCGDRWSFWVSDEDGYDVPTIYGESIYEAGPGMFRTHAKLHYADGTVVDYKFKAAQ
jgi:hypothetical protein